MNYKSGVLFLLFLLPLLVAGQNLASEDSLSENSKKPETYLGGYGNFFYQYNSNEKKSEINLERVVLFFGHRFNEKFSFFSELEIEDAKISGGEDGGEVAIEQAYIKYNLCRNSYITAGLFLPRIGILNENHLPNTFNGNERTLVETYLIPSTWRELGIGYYTHLDVLPIDLSFAVINGLNSEAFEHGTLIREGRYEGRRATANNMAFTGAVQYNQNNFLFQLSGYMGGTVGLSTLEADSLKLNSGPLGTPVYLAEADVQYKLNAFTCKVLGTTISIPDADKINSAFANNTPENAYGFYAEAAYDLLYNNMNENNNSLILFVRYENFNLNYKIPDNGIDDPQLVQNHIIAGFSYLPIPNIAIKGDVRLSHTGDQNPALVVNPGPTTPPFKNNNTFINLGVGFSF